ncbi:MAG: Gfo/Idh/MocA family protein, partial [Candidatus Bipolaricaulia bacterium]
LERADALIAACREAGLRLGVISQHRFDPAIVTLKRAIDQGRFGKLLLGDAYVKWHRTQEYYDEGGWRGTWTLDGGGAFINQSIHFIDLLRWLMGPVRTVWARTATVAHQIEAEDLGVAFLEYESGAFGVVEGATALYPGLPERIEIHGERGTVVVDGPTIRVWAFREGDPPPAMEDEGAGTGTGSGAAVATAIEIESHRRQIADFATAIREERDPAVTGEEGRRTLEIVTAIYRSARLGRPVSLFK